MVAIAEQAHEGERQSDGAHHQGPALYALELRLQVFARRHCGLPVGQTVLLSAFFRLADSKTVCRTSGLLTDPRWCRRCFELLFFLWRKFGHRNPLAQLQRPDIGNDAPAVIRDYSRGVARHRAEAVGHHIEKMPDRSIFEPLDMVRRRLAISSLDHETLPVP